MPLFDAHCHLQDERLAPRLDAVVASARQAGVEALVCNGTAEADWPRVAQLAAEHPGWVIPSYGIHPWCVADRADGWLDRLRERLIAAPAGVGEIGLDFVVAADDASRTAQQDAFLAQWRLSIELGRPVSIHCRKAAERLVWLLKREGPHPVGFLVHSFSGDPGTIKPLLRLGGYLSFGGSLTRTGNKRGPRAIAAIPADRLLAETDAPDLPPVIDGQLVEQSEPAHVVHPLSRLAELKSMPVDAMVTQLWNNARRLFGPVWP